MTKGKTVVHVDIGERQIEDIQGIDVIVTTKDNTKILYDKWYITEQEEPCGDAISREAVLSLPRNRTYELSGVSKNESIDVDLIEALPPVIPEPKTDEENIHREREQAYMQGYEDACKKYRQEPETGQWILSIEDWNKWTCSECGYYNRTDIHVSLGYNYCPKCGADMRGTENDT